MGIPLLAGRTFGPQDNDFELIGIVKGVKFGSLQENQQTSDYFPVAQQVRYLNHFEVRYLGDFGAIASAARHGYGCCGRLTLASVCVES
jgi:hypothetical protein